MRRFIKFTSVLDCKIGNYTAEKMSGQKASCFVTNEILGNTLVPCAITLSIIFKRVTIKVTVNQPLLSKDNGPPIRDSIIFHIIFPPSP